MLDQLQVLICGLVLQDPVTQLRDGVELTVVPDDHRMVYSVSHTVQLVTNDVTALRSRVRRLELAVVTLLLTTVVTVALMISAELRLGAATTAVPLSE